MKITFDKTPFSRIPLGIMLFSTMTSSRMILIRMPCCDLMTVLLSPFIHFWLNVILQNAFQLNVEVPYQRPISQEIHQSSVYRKL